MTTRLLLVWAAMMCLAGLCLAQLAQVKTDEKDEWVSVTGQAAGEDETAKEEARNNALRKAVEQATGVFLKAQSETENYKAVYDKVLADAVGYVKKHEVQKVTLEDGKTIVKLRALVSSQKFEKDWASIAHTLSREGNPRVIIAIAEASRWKDDNPDYNLDQPGTVQGKMEEYFLSKGIKLVDRGTAKEVAKRDLLLASIKDDAKELAAIGGRFKSDVLVLGTATAKLGKELDIEKEKMYQYTATLRVRVVQADSANVLAVKVFGPVTVNILQRSGGEEKALAKLTEESSPKLLAAVVEAWRSRASVSRTVQLSISGMEYDGWKLFKAEADKLEGVQNLRLREITEGVANIDVEYKHTNETLADRLCELKAVPLSVTEITANRIKLKVKAKDQPKAE